MMAKSFEYPPHGIRATWLSPAGSPANERELAAALDDLIKTVRHHLKGNKWDRYQEETLEHAEKILAKAMERAGK